MPSEVIVTPELLAAQGAEMSSLMSEYESLFSNVSSLLTEINSSWSPNMANNFSGKIQSAQKSFSNVVGMLGNGSSAAKAASQIFADDMAGAVGNILGLMESDSSVSDWIKAAVNGTDGSALKGLDEGSVARTAELLRTGDLKGAVKFLNEKGISANFLAGNDSASQDIPILTEKEKQEIYDILPEETKRYIDTAQEVDSWLVKNYEKIPEAARKTLEEKLPSEVTNPISVMHDIYSGEVKASTLGKTAEIVKGDKLMGTIVQASAEAAFSSKADSYKDASYEAARKAHDSFVNGNVGKGIQYTTEALTHGVGEGLYRLGDAFLNTGGILLEKSKNPSLKKVGSWLHNLM